MSTANDNAVVEAVLAGDTEQFDLLVSRYRDALFRAAASRIGGSSADDAVQEAFLCAYKSLHTYNPRYSFRTWLWTILLNQCRRHHSQQKRRQLSVPSGDVPVGRSEVHNIASAEHDPATALLAKERSQLIASTLGRLSEVKADALRLRFFGGLKFQEIADVMGCSLSTAKNRVRWGLAEMSQLLIEASSANERSFDHTSENTGQ